MAVYIVNEKQNILPSASIFTKIIKLIVFVIGILIILQSLGTPLLLGSLWALIPGLGAAALKIERYYGAPQDVEWALAADGAIYILQCRPQGQLTETQEVEIPGFLAEKDIVFSTHFIVPQGVIPHVEYVVFIPPEPFFLMPVNERFELARTIGRITEALAGKSFPIPWVPTRRSAAAESCRGRPPAGSRRSS